MNLSVVEVSDNNPGLLKRYVSWEVEESPVVPVCVVVDGMCNHADNDIDSQYEDEPKIKCNNPQCEAWKFVRDYGDQGWQDEKFIEGDSL